MVGIAETGTHYFLDSTNIKLYLPLSTLLIVVTIEGWGKGGRETTTKVEEEVSPKCTYHKSGPYVYN